MHTVFGKIMTAHEYIHEGIFELEAGGSITGLKVAYHTSEKPWQTGDSRKVIWLCHALTANSDAQDWWPELTGPGKLFDTDKYFVVCANMLGSPYGSSGPASENPSTGRPYLLDFPKITVRDIVRANSLVRKSLEIERIDLIVGGSIGGFQALEWSVMEPDVIGKAVFIALSAKTTPWLNAVNEAMRMALEADATFLASESLKGGAAGLQCARSIGMLLYRNYEGFNATQQESGNDTLFASRAASYQRYQGKKLSDRFDAYSYRYLCDCADSNNVGRGRGGVEAALGTVKASCTVIGIDSDRLFPVNEQQLIASCIPGAVYHEITSGFGHDGFLLENVQLEEIIRPLMP